MNYLKKHTKAFFTEPKISLGIFLAALLFMAALSSSAVYFGKLKGRADLGKHYRMGEQVEVRGVSVGVEQVRTEEQSSQGFPLGEGNKFVIPTIAVANNTDANFELIPLLYFYLKDEQGNVYNVMAAPIRGNQLAGPILPKDFVREEIGFEVPKDKNNFTLYFERGTPDHPVVAIDLFGQR